METKEVLSLWEGRLGMIQEYLIIRQTLLDHGKTDDDVRQYVADEKKLRSKSGVKVVTFKQKKCPKCSRPMTLIKVNTRPNNQIGGDAKAMWWCPNDNCNYSIEVKNA